MAFLFREKPTHTEILNRFCKKLASNSKHKSLTWIVENIERITVERNNANKQLREQAAKTKPLQDELTQLKEAIRQKHLADQELVNLIHKND